MLIAYLLLKPHRKKCLVSLMTFSTVLCGGCTDQLPCTKWQYYFGPGSVGRSITVPKAVSPAALVVCTPGSVFHLSSLYIIKDQLYLVVAGMSHGIPLICCGGFLSFKCHQIDGRNLMVLVRCSRTCRRLIVVLFIICLSNLIMTRLKLPQNGQLTNM